MFGNGREDESRASGRPPDAWTAATTGPPPDPAPERAPVLTTRDRASCSQRATKSRAGPVRAIAGQTKAIHFGTGAPTAPPLEGASKTSSAGPGLPASSADLGERGEPPDVSGRLAPVGPPPLTAAEFAPPRAVAGWITVPALSGASPEDDPALFVTLWTAVPVAAGTGTGAVAGEVPTVSVTCLAGGLTASPASFTGRVTVSVASWTGGAAVSVASCTGCGTIPVASSAGGTTVPVTSPSGAVTVSVASSTGAPTASLIGPVTPSIGRADAPVEEMVAADPEARRTHTSRTMRRTASALLVLTIATLPVSVLRIGEGLLLPATWTYIRDGRSKKGLGIRTGDQFAPFVAAPHFLTTLRLPLAEDARVLDRGRRGWAGLVGSGGVCGKTEALAGAVPRDCIQTKPEASGTALLTGPPLHRDPQHRHRRGSRNWQN
jgi:hypothetical protein